MSQVYEVTYLLPWELPPNHSVFASQGIAVDQEAKGEIAVCVLEKSSSKVAYVTHVRSGFSVSEKELIVTDFFLQPLYFFTSSSLLSWLRGPLIWCEAVAVWHCSMVPGRCYNSYFSKVLNLSP